MRAFAYVKGSEAHYRPGAPEPAPAGRLRRRVHVDLAAATARHTDPLQLHRYNVEPYPPRTFELVLSGRLRPDRAQGHRRRHARAPPVQRGARHVDASDLRAEPYEPARPRGLPRAARRGVGRAGDVRRRSSTGGSSGTRRGSVDVAWRGWTGRSSARPRTRCSAMVIDGEEAASRARCTRHALIRARAAASSRSSRRRTSSEARGARASRSCSRSPNAPTARDLPRAARLDGDRRALRVWAPRRCSRRRPRAGRGRALRRCEDAAAGVAEPRRPRRASTSNWRYVDSPRELPRAAATGAATRSSGRRGTAGSDGRAGRPRRRLEGLLRRAVAAAAGRALIALPAPEQRAALRCSLGFVPTPYTLRTSSGKALARQAGLPTPRPGGSRSATPTSSDDAGSSSSPSRSTRPSGARGDGAEDPRARGAGGRGRRARRPRRRRARCRTNCRVGSFAAPDARAARRALRGRCSRGARRRRPVAVVAHMCPIYAVLAAPLARPLRVPLLLWYTHWARTRTLDAAERVVDGGRLGRPALVPARVGEGRRRSGTASTCAEFPCADARTARRPARSSRSAATRRRRGSRRSCAARSSRSTAGSTCGSSSRPGAERGRARAPRRARAAGRRSSTSSGASGSATPCCAPRCRACSRAREALVNNMRGRRARQGRLRGRGELPAGDRSNPVFDELLDGLDAPLMFERDDPAELAERLEALAALDADARARIGPDAARAGRGATTRSSTGPTRSSRWRRRE